MAAQKGGKLAVNEGGNVAPSTSNKKAGKTVRAKKINTPSTNLKSGNNGQMYDQAFETGKALVNPAVDGMRDGFTEGLGDLDQMVTDMQDGLIGGMQDLLKEKLGNYVQK